ncbi:MAG: dipeptidase [Firmicutes bacterium]|nr:dipeptidase [Bacillota bacterium]
MNPGHVGTASHGGLGPVVLGHDDAMMDVVERRRAGKEGALVQEHLGRMRASGVGLALLAVYVESAYKPFASLERAVRCLGGLLAELSGAGDEFFVVRNAGDLDRLREGSVGIVIALEGAEPLGATLDNLYVFHQAGVRSLGLTWNQRNLVADGIWETGGLTEFGRQVVSLSESLEILVDVSHLNERSFWDVAEVARKPFVASHSNARAVCDHPRNLTDDQIRAISRSGGVVGLNFYSPTLAPRDASIDDAVAHLRHMIAVAGEDHVALGPDFVDFMVEQTKRETGAPPQLTRGLESVECIPAFIEHLADLGFSEETLRKVLGSNFIRVLRRVLPRL